uniref:Uncharacterized protein n=1 Tax=Anguilla anguilla TaxID=7936 RepID=A0A0E9U069_ANGAN
MEGAETLRSSYNL